MLGLWLRQIPTPCGFQIKMCKPIFAWKPWLCFTWNNSLSRLIVYSGAFFAAVAWVGVSEVFIVVGFDHFLDEGAPLHFIFEGGDKETAFVFPVTPAFVVGIPGDYSFGLTVAAAFEEGIVLNVEHVMLIAYLEIEGGFPHGKEHGHRLGPGVSGGATLLDGFNFPVLGNGPILSIVSARHVHLDAVQLGIRPIEFGGIDHGLVLGVAAIYIEIVWGELPVGTVNQYVIEGGPDAVNGMCTQGSQCQNDNCSPHALNIYYYVPRETQPRSASGKMLVFFHLLTDGCRTMAMP